MIQRESHFQDEKLYMIHGYYSISFKYQWRKILLLERFGKQNFSSNSEKYLIQQKMSYEKSVLGKKADQQSEWLLYKFCLTEIQQDL